MRKQGIFYFVYVYSTVMSASCRIIYRNIKSSCSRYIEYGQLAVMLWPHSLPYTVTATGEGMRALLIL